MHTSAQRSVANILSVRLQLKTLKFPYTSPKVCDTSDSVKYHPYQACTTYIVVIGSCTLTAQNVSNNKMLLTTGMDANIQPITYNVGNFSRQDFIPDFDWSPQQSVDSAQIPWHFSVLQKKGHIEITQL